MKGGTTPTMAKSRAKHDIEANQLARDVEDMFMHFDESPEEEKPKEEEPSKDKGEKKE